MAKDLNYKDCRGLLRYLRYKCDKPIDNIYIQSLKKIVVIRRINEIQNKKLDMVEECKRQLIKEILNSNDKELIKKIRLDILAACNSQIVRLEHI